MKYKNQYDYWPEYEIKANHENEICNLWPFLSDIMVHLFPSLSVFYEDHNKDWSLIKAAQFSKCSFGEIWSQHFKTLSYIWD